MTPQVTASMPIALITGCSSGIGRETVPRLADAGFLVIATARNLDDIQDLRDEGRIEVDRLDITDPADHHRVVQGIMERHGRLDVLVNNAGFGAVAAVEETPPELMQRLFDTNLFGLHRLTQTCLPILRAQGHGRIINVSSVSGHIGIPMTGAYCATKFALRGLTLTMDVEIRPHGLRAILVEPGFIRTPFRQRSNQETQNAIKDRENNPYAAFHSRWIRRRSTGHGAPPSTVAMAIVKASASKRPRIHYYAPFHAKFYTFLKRMLPESVWQHGLGRRFSD